MLKKILIGIVALIVLLLLVGFLLPSGYEVNRDIVIDATPAQIYPHVASLKEWPKWTPWHGDNPDYKGMVTTYSGPESGVGAKSAWQHESGNGSMEITSADPDTGVRYTLAFEGMSPAEGHVTFEPAGEGKTKVIFGMKGDLGSNPVGRYFGLMMDGMMGAEFEQCINGLKTLSEATSAPTLPVANPGEGDEPSQSPDDNQSPDTTGSAADDSTSETTEESPAENETTETPAP